LAVVGIHEGRAAFVLGVEPSIAEDVRTAFGRRARFATRGVDDRRV